MQNAIVLLCFRPDEQMIAFYRGFQQHGYHVYVLVDDNHWQTENSQGIQYIQIDDSLCVAEGFYGLNPEIKKPSNCSAWDKAVYFFSKEKTSYDNVWFIEDDVFIPALQTIVSIDRKYGDADLISASNTINTTGELLSWWWWQFIPKNVLPLPWAASMVCAVRISQLTLQHVGQLIQEQRAKMNDKRLLNQLLYGLFMLFIPKIKWRYWQYRKYPFIEYLFHTVVIHQGLKVIKADELSGIVWRKEWTVSEMNVSGLYHPIKDKQLHHTLRLQMAKP
jgi:hypothetical protein